MRLIHATWILIGLSLWGCSDPAMFEENQEIENAAWKMDQPKRFEFEVNDTSSVFNFFVNIRNGQEYPYSNVYLFVDMEDPHGEKSRDVIECKLANERGEWLGSGVGTIKENRLLFATHQFRKYTANKESTYGVPGRYKISISHGMRVDELVGIYDIGLRISPKNTN
ncbi:MAG: gliding motility lipoprotein GldH [Flavobacteriales bacterium]